jgi:sugar phosphate isomerase/epimerase
MRRAIISDEVSQHLPTAAALAMEHGFEGLAIRSIDATPPHELTDAALDRARTIVADAGLRVAGFLPPALKRPLPAGAADRRQTRDLLDRALTQADRLGAGEVRMFSFYRDGPPDPVRAAEAAAPVLAGLDVPDGVTLTLETGTRSHTPTLRLALDFLAALGDDRIGLLWDPGNTVFSGFDPAPYPGDYAEAAKLIRHVHVKDPAGTSGYVRLGTGDLPWPEILAGLHRDGFAGWVTLETHWRIDRVLTGAQRDEPWGAGISDGGVAASRLCMRALNEWWPGSDG